MQLLLLKSLLIVRQKRKCTVWRPRSLVQTRTFQLVENDVHLADTTWYYSSKTQGLLERYVPLLVCVIVTRFVKEISLVANYIFLNKPIVFDGEIFSLLVLSVCFFRIFLFQILTYILVGLMAFSSSSKLGFHLRPCW